MNKKKWLRQQLMCWAVKLHSNSAVEMENERSAKVGHVVFKIEGKERPVVILSDGPEREGVKHFLCAYLTKSSFNTKNIFPCKLSNRPGGFVEIPRAEISENLITRFDSEIEEMEFRTFKRQLARNELKRSLSK